MLASEFKTKLSVVFPATYIFSVCGLMPAYMFVPGRYLALETPDIDNIVRDCVLGKGLE